MFVLLCVVCVAADPSQGPSLLTHIHEQTLSNTVAERTLSKKTTSSTSDSLSDEQKKKLIRTYGTQSDDDNLYPPHCVLSLYQ